LTAWLPVLAAAATIIAAVATIGVTLAIHFDNKIGAVRTEVQGLDTRLTKLEGAVKAISSQQSDQTQKLVRDLLSSAKTAENLPMAKKSIEIATQLTRSLREDKRPAPPEFFQGAFESASQSKQPELKTATFGAQLQLAEYRSALQKPPSISSSAARIPVGPKTEPGDFGNGTGVYGFRESLKLERNIGVGSNGAVFDASAIPEGASLFVAPSASAALNKITVFGIVVLARTQKLDGISWKDVTFVNTHILYGGGDVNLQNVKFINCTFETQPTDHGERLLQYAAVSENSLSIGE
jgi:hypothetical protein